MDSGPNRVATSEHLPGSPGSAQGCTRRLPKAGVAEAPFPCPEAAPILFLLSQPPCLQTPFLSPTPEWLISRKPSVCDEALRTLVKSGSGIWPRLGDKPSCLWSPFVPHLPALWTCPLHQGNSRGGGGAPDSLPSRIQKTTAGPQFGGQPLPWSGIGPASSQSLLTGVSFCQGNGQRGLAAGCSWHGTLLPFSSSRSQILLIAGPDGAPAAGWIHVLVLTLQ